MLLYLLIDHGPKPRGSLWNCNGAKQQMTNFRHALQGIEGADDLPVRHDYSRKHSTLSDLPELRSVLSRAKEIGDAILIDDFRRVFIKCSRSQRVALFKELQGFSGHFRDLRTGKDIGQLTHSTARHILSVESPYRFELAKTPRSPRSIEDKREQTRKATQASKSARGAAADQKARALDELYRSLSSRTQDVSMVALAREANERGLKTTAGRGWTGTAVTRALKRLTPPS